MARVIPSSLTPHVVVLPSPDLSELLDSVSLPPLPEILQSFSPLPQVTTRTSSLTSVPHPSFALRFSDLNEIEEACREDEEGRAARMIDWMSARISKRCDRWVQEMENMGEKEVWRTPWWDEVRRCAEGDSVPSKAEGWNHPVAVILAASTTAPNPLQAITTLHARPLQLPSWVDSNHLKYTLIIHPQDSPLSDEEANALFNAVKRQFGIDTYLLSLTLPSPPPPPVPVPPLLPRLPRPSVPDSPPQTRNATKRNSVNNARAESLSISSLNLLQNDIQQTSRFVREFVVGCLIPWMEKCVMEWNDAFTSNRRLPSRLFSSTRKLFGSSTSPAPVHHSSFSAASTPGRASLSSINGSSGPPPPSQQRRLAEFATILGDYKLAITVWEALRKDSKGGSDILPILSAPTPTLPLHASNALSSIHPANTDLPSYAQLRALLHAVRWEAGILPQDFLSSILEGERWLVWAAGNAEEAPAALLIAHAAHLSIKKNARRRAAYWYAVAASRLEKCGIKPLTMHFLRQAQKLYKHRPMKELSPSFWDTEGRSMEESPWFDSIMLGIEHPLGRLLYTTGDVLSAVQMFLGLLRDSESSISSIPADLSDVESSTRDRLSLDDFRVAFSHLRATEPEKVSNADLKPPFKFCQAKQCKVRFIGNGSPGNAEVWAKREEDWLTFWRARGGKEGFAKSGDVVIGETFWVDLVLRNPLDTEVNVSNLTVLVDDTTEPQGSSGDSPKQSVDVEVIEEVILGPHETRTISIALRAQYPGTFIISQASYEFLSLLPCIERLASRGRRLNATPAQRQKPTYGPDVLMKVTVSDASHRLVAGFVEEGRLDMIQGETKSMNLWLSNMGSNPIREIWMVPDAEDEIWVGESNENEEDNACRMEVMKSNNSILPPQPLRIPVPEDALDAEEGMHVPLTLHTELPGRKDLCIAFVYRESDSDAFYIARISRTVDVQPFFHLSAITEPDQSSNGQFIVNVSLRNLSSNVIQVTQILTLSPFWATSLISKDLIPLSASQSCNVLIKARKWNDGQGSRDTVEFVKSKLGDILHGRPVAKTHPPAIDLCCNSIAMAKESRQSTRDGIVATFIHGGRRNFISKHVLMEHPYIPSTSHPYIFPLYNPSSFDIILFWQFSSSLSHSRQRAGHVSIHGLHLGATHAPLQDIIEVAENAKVKSMYAETARENMGVLDAIRESEWNMQMNPLDVVVSTVGEITHDFSQGPYWTFVPFTIKNYSLTHEAGFVLKLNNSMTVPAAVSSNVLPPPYVGRLTFRGTIAPSRSANVKAKLWISRPGIYSLDGWILVTEVYDHEAVSEGNTNPPSNSPKARKIRSQYTQDRPISDRTCLVVRDASTKVE